MLDHWTMRSLDDWRWYFNQAKAAMGIQAIDYEAWSISANGGGSREPVSTEMPLRTLQAARRHASIERRLLGMPDVERRIVRATCEDEPVELRKGFGDAGMGNVANLTAAAALGWRLSRSTRSLNAWLDKLGSKLQTGRAGTMERVQQERIALDVEKLMEHAHEAYVGARL